MRVRLSDFILERNILLDHDFLSRVENFGDLAALGATFSDIFTANEQKRLFMSFR